MRIITISGLDGSGKSTQIELLKSYLESQSKKVFYFHAIQLGIANKMTKIFNFCHPEPVEGSNTEIAASPSAPRNDTVGKSVTKSGRFGIFLRKIFLKIDLCRFEKLVKKLEKDGYDFLISDRYFYDSIVNVEFLKEFSPFSKGRVREGFLSKSKTKIPLSPPFTKGEISEPSIAIYLQTDPEIIMQREKKPDQGLEYLERKKEIYDKYAGIWNLKIINGNRNKEEIFEEIKSFLL